MIDEVTAAAKYQWLSELQTPLGRKWRPRIEASEAYHRENSHDWDYLRDMYVNMQRIVDSTWSPKVAIAYSVITGNASDVYFNNPESWIQAKSGDPDGTISQAFRDIANTIHRDADTEGIMRKCLIDDGWAGFGVHWAYFEQIDAPPEEPEPQAVPAGAPTGEEAGEQVAAPGYGPPQPEPISQKVCGDYCEPWDFRVDPDGRDWKLRDHKYIARKYRKTIAQLLELPFADDRGKAMLYTWAKNRRPSRTHYSDSKWGSDATSIDKDISYIPVDMWEIWDRVTKTVIHIPVSADFDFASYPWPRAWRYGDTFPATFVGFNWEPGDSQRKRGFYPIPLLRLIRDQIENINDLEGLWMEAATSDVIKFLTIKGLLEEQEITNLTNNLSRQIVAIDVTKIREFFPTAVNSLGEIDLRRIFHQLEPNAKGASFEYEKAIEHELRQIARIIGAGPQDRFGLPEARSATEAAGLIDAMGKRGRTKSELAANKYDEITEKFFLILKTMQTLPIEYRASIDGFSEGVWQQWTNLAAVRTMSLAFEHRVGSSRSRDPQAEATARNAFGQMVLPVYQASQQFDKVDAIVKWMAEPQNFRDLGIFQSQSKEIAKQLAYMTALLKAAPQLASDPDFADEKANLSSQLALSLLSPAGTNQVAMKVNEAIASGKTAMPWGASNDPRGRKSMFEHREQAPSSGSLPAQASPGERAFGASAAAGSAAAGMTNAQ